MAKLRKINGSYYAYFYDRTRMPARKSYPLQVSLKDAAERKLKRLEKEWAQGTFDPWRPVEDAPQRFLTVKEAAARFLAERSHLRPKTLKHYRQQLGAIDLPPNLMIRDLAAEHLRPYIYAPKIAQATKRKRYITLRTFTRWAVEARLLEEDPLADVPKPQGAENTPRFLTVQDVEKLIAAIDYAIETGDGRTDVAWLREAILLAISTGLRSGELRHLRWSDVDLVSGFLDVRNREGFRTKSGKERRVPVAPTAREVFLRLRAERAEGAADGFVLTDARGKPIEVSRLSHRFKDFVRLARLDERFRFHDTRHTCGSWLAMEGVSMRIIQQILGHASVTTTEIYGHLSPDVMKHAMEKTFGGA